MDLDDDGDGYSDAAEIKLGTNPLSPFSKPDDGDNDGKPDSIDNDDDNDGVPDAEDAFPQDPNESVDTDSDGKGDNTDTDDDGDGYSDQVEIAAGSDPLNPLSKPIGKKIETAVSGHGGGGTTPIALFMLLLLSVLKRVKNTDAIKRFLPLFFVTIIIALGIGETSTLHADNLWKNYETKNSQEEDSKCGTNKIASNGFTPCNYIVGGLTRTKVHPEGEADGWSTSDDISTGYNVALGRHFTPRLFGEVGYTDMGKAELSNSDASITQKESISYKVPSVQIGYLFRDPKESFNPYVKGGISAIQNKISNERVPFEKQTSVQATFGLGLQWQSAESGLFTRAGVDFYDKDAIATGITIGCKLP